MIDTRELPATYLDRFGGLGRLLGKAALERLHAAHVCVVGVGGVGSWTVEGLARSGVGALTLIDLDDMCVTVGGAGGRRDATRIRAGDLGEATGDDRLRLVRKKPRRDHGIAHGEGVHFGVRCVDSAERPVYPRADGTCQTEQEPGSSLRMDCASGLGAAMFVTAAFGFAAAGERGDANPVAFVGAVDDGAAHAQSWQFAQERRAMRGEPRVLEMIMGVVEGKHGATGYAKGRKRQEISSEIGRVIFE
jgi:tRNA A37 threonylcarbamoyladenosine dehydratase